MSKILLFFFILNFTARAQISEYLIPTCKNLNQPQSFLVDSGVTCESLEHFEKIFQTIKADIGLPSIFPRIFLKSKGYESWSTYGNLLFVNQVQMAWNQPKTDSQRDMVWMHELGHLVFQEMLRKDFKELDCFTKYMEKDADMKWTNKNPFYDSSKVIESSWSPLCKYARDLQIAYSELFADYVVAIVLSDSTAPLKYMLSKSAPQNEQTKILLYDFGSQHNLDSCNDDPHFYFAPVRSVIGSKYFPIRQSKTQMIMMLYNVLKNDLLFYATNSQSLSDCKSANLRLIPKIH